MAVVLDTPTSFSFLNCVPSIYSLLVKQTDTMLTCSYSATRKLCSASTSTTSLTNQSRASFSTTNVHPLLSLPYTVQRDGRIWHLLGAATFNQGLLTSAEEKVYKTITTHTSHTWAAVLVSMLFEQMPYTPRRAWMSYSWETAIFLRLWCVSLLPSLSHPKLNETINYRKPWHPLWKLHPWPFPLNLSENLENIVYIISGRDGFVGKLGQSLSTRCDQLSSAWAWCWLWWRARSSSGYCTRTLRPSSSSVLWR